MSDDALDLFARLADIKPDPENPFSKLLERNAAHVPTHRKMASLRDLMGDSSAEAPILPSGEFGAPPFSSLGSLAAMLPSAPAMVVPAMAVPMPAPKPQGISFYRTNGAVVAFNEPHRFSWAMVLPVAGIYAILVQDDSCSPRKFRVLYFGQASNLSERPTTSHERYDDWVRAAGSAESLYVAYALMWGSEEKDRTEIESGLIEYYGLSLCNDAYNPFRRALGF
jgi:hypothetical protein